MAVHHVLSGKLAITVVELHALLQLEAPRPAVLGHLPARGQPGLIHTRLGGDLEETLERRVMLDHVVRGPDYPRTPVIPILLDQPHHQAVRLGLAAGRSLRRDACHPQHQEHRQHAEYRCGLPEPCMCHNRPFMAAQQPFVSPSAYLHGVSCLHAEMRKVCPISPPSQPENGQSLMILGFTTTSMYTSKRGILSKFSNL